MSWNAAGRKVIKGPVIHKNYNVWVDQLSKRIKIHTKDPPKAEKTETTSRKDPVFIADELGKLVILRQKGVLSQEEFDQQKAKLLAQ
jgi:hypothetical protein